MAVRQLSGRAAARARRQRARAATAPSPPSRTATGSTTTSPRRAWAIVSTFPLALTAEVEGVRRAGLLELRARRLPQGRGNVVRRAAGERRGRRPARRPAEPAARAGDRAADADGARRQRRDRLPGCATQRDALTGWGRLDVTAALTQLSRRPAAARPARAERRRRRRRAAALWGREPARGDARLLGRPERRLRDPAQARPARLRQRARAGRHDTNLILWQPGTRHVDDLASLRPRRAPVGPSRPARIPLLPRGEGRHLLRPGEARLARQRPLQADDRQGLR